MKIVNDLAKRSENGTFLGSGETLNNLGTDIEGILMVSIYERIFGAEVGDGRGQSGSDECDELGVTFVRKEVDDLGQREGFAAGAVGRGEGCEGSRWRCCQGVEEELAGIFHFPVRCNLDTSGNDGCSGL